MYEVCECTRCNEPWEAEEPEDVKRCYECDEVIASDYWVYDQESYCSTGCVIETMLAEKKIHYVY